MPMLKADFLSSTDVISQKAGRDGSGTEVLVINFERVDIPVPSLRDGEVYWAPIRAITRLSILVGKRAQ